VGIPSRDEALFGQRPFAGGTAEERAQALREGRVTPPPRGSRVPVAVRDAVLRGLAAEPTSRHPSLDALLARLEAGARGRAQSKVEGQPSGEQLGRSTDLPVTIATVRIGDLARSSLNLKSASGGAIAQGATVDVMFPGGLLSDGCTLAPRDNPLPKVGEQAVFFLTRYPVGDAMNAWMYTGTSNSLYLYWRSSGTSDVTVSETSGYTGWYGYTWNDALNGCMRKSTVNLNNTYDTGAHYAKTVSIHEIGHTLGIHHHTNCNSIMYTAPTQCTAALTSCDAQAIAEIYPY
jgi:hypothetical protein